MRRSIFATLPLIVAAVVFALASPTLRAAQHDHPGDAPSAHSCACCGNSSSAAMKHEGGGCCGNMAAKDAATPVDHAAMNHDSPAADVQKMDHAAAGGGCCGNMATKMAADQKPAGTPMAHDAGMSCCSHMAMNHDTAKSSDTAPMNFGAMSCPPDAAANNSPAADATAAGHDHAAGGCCASMASDKSAGGCCGDMAKMHQATK